MLNIPKILFYYFKTFILPVHLSFYQIWVVSKANLNNFYIPILILSAVIIAISYLGYYYYQTNKKLFVSYVFFFLWLILSLTLLIQIVPAELTVAERWFYFP